MTELGQTLFSNAEIRDHEAYWATDGLNMIAQAIAEYRGHIPSKYGSIPLLTSNDGEEEFCNDVFEMRTYCWCDGSTEHNNGCPPNFVYHKNGLVISWYKHAGRGISSSMSYPGIKNWAKAVITCIESIYE